MRQFWHCYHPINPKVVKIFLKSKKNTPDQISDHKNKEEKWVESLSLQAAMEHLNERERYIISLRFFDGRTQMEVARDVGISQAQVSRLEKNALRIMRQYLVES